MKILDKLWNGDVHPFESILPDSNEYKALKIRQRELRDALEADMDEKQKDLLDKFYTVLLQMGDELSKENFYCGVKVGAEFMMDIAYGDKPPDETE